MSFGVFFQLEWERASPLVGPIKTIQAIQQANSETWVFNRFRGNLMKGVFSYNCLFQVLAIKHRWATWTQKPEWKPGKYLGPVLVSTSTPGTNWRQPLNGTNISLLLKNAIIASQHTPPPLTPSPGLGFDGSIWYAPKKQNNIVWKENDKRSLPFNNYFSTRWLGPPLFLFLGPPAPARLRKHIWLRLFTVKDLIKSAINLSSVSTPSGVAGIECSCKVGRMERVSRGWLR